MTVRQLPSQLQEKFKWFCGTVFSKTENYSGTGAGRFAWLLFLQRVSSFFDAVSFLIIHWFEKGRFFPITQKFFKSQAAFNLTERFMPSDTENKEKPEALLRHLRLSQMHYIVSRGWHQVLFERTWCETRKLKILSASYAERAALRRNCSECKSLTSIQSSERSSIIGVNKY